MAASILEENAAKFRSNYKDVPLSQIMDTNIRGFVQGQLAELFGKESLDDCQKKKVDIFRTAEKLVQEEFEKFGITVLYFGNRGGLNYLNPKVQEGIDSEYIENLKEQIETKKLAAQLIRNETAKEVALVQAKAARTLQEGAEALEFTTQLEIAKMQAEARKEMAEKVTGRLPTTILPAGGEGSNMLLNLR